jgi:F0F1-type ATP synthase membrane subunit a
MMLYFNTNNIVLQIIPSEQNLAFHRRTGEISPQIAAVGCHHFVGRSNPPFTLSLRLRTNIISGHRVKITW